jgi:NTE family protein
MDQSEKRLIIGVFKGGGAKGALYAGALEAVQDHRMWFSEVAGSSAGAITASFIAAGATPGDLRTLEKKGRELLVFPSKLTSAMNLRNTGGILSFEALREWLATSLNSLCVSRLNVDAFGDDGPTFKQLAEADGIPLHVTCADLFWRAPVVLNAQLTPDLFVAHAAAASSSIPLVFEAPKLKGATGSQGQAILVSDGGVMANLPMFVFSDDGYRSVAGLGPRGPERVVGFTFVDRDAPRHTGQSGLPGEEYRRRFAPLSRAMTYGDELTDAGLEASQIKHVRPPRSRSARWWLPNIIALRLISAVLRVIEPVVVTLLNWGLKGAQLRGYRPVALPVSDRRAKRWIRFGDRVVGVAPGYLVAGVLLVVPVLVFGMPSVLAFLWPDWRTIASTGGVFSRIIHVLFSIFLYLLVVIGCLLVVVFAVLGLAGFIVGWVAKPVATSIGPHLVATFMRNPQEPAWSGAGGEDVIIRIVVPEGWTALRSTPDSEVMAAEIERVRVSVGEQLDRAGFAADH